jgi:hypothetical protein
MGWKRQSVAIRGNGFCLSWRFRPSIDLPLIAIDCAHWAHKGSMRAGSLDYLEPARS